MRKHLALFLLLVSQVLLGSHQRALHMFYDHIPNTNAYIFTAMIHFEPNVNRDSIQVSSNSPAGSFMLYNTATILVANGSCVANGSIHIYQSDTLPLGTIPTLGYTFGLEDCCRQGGITNMDVPTSASHYIEISMFPEPGLTYASSSPRMVNPVLQQFINIPSTSLSLPAIDPDNDSLFYKFVDVMDNNGNLSYYPGYSAADPLGINTNTTINQNTGEITATNVQPIAALANLQVESYKNGNLTSTVQMDFLMFTLMQPVTRPNIALTNASGSNVVFKNDAYYASMLVGDSLSFDITGSAPLNDSVFIGGTSELFTNAIGTIGPCVSYCASFTSATNFKAVNTVLGSFSFKAEPSHLKNQASVTYPISFAAASKDSCSPQMFRNLFVYVTVHNTIGLNELKPKRVNIFPNPTTSIVTISRETSDLERLQLLDLSGRILLSSELTDFEFMLDLSDLKKGAYIISSDAGWMKKVILN